MKDIKVTKVMHQGDVLFLKLEKAIETKGLETIKPTEGRGLVLQHGEALGHYHVIKEQSGFQAFMIGEKDSVKEMALVVNEPITITHEEHNPIALDPGFWISRTQREKVNGLVRPVVD